MKKIISLCCIILSVSILLVCFASCESKKGEDALTSISASSSESVKGFSVEIEETKAVVKKDGKEFQTLMYPVNFGVSVDMEYAAKNNEFIDMNFDGEPDFYIAVSSVDGVIRYFCWLYNVTDQKFDYSVILSELTNISVDDVNQRILSKVTRDGVEHVYSYKWVDGNLILDTDYNTDNGGIPAEVTQAVSDGAIGVEKTTSPNSEKGTSDKNSSDSNNTVSTTKAKKPANTTTTAPNKNEGVVLGEGKLDADGWY